MQYVVVVVVAVGTNNHKANHDHFSVKSVGKKFLNVS